MKCSNKKCLEKLSDTDIYCHACGKPSGVLSGQLAAQTIIRDTWEEFKLVRSNHYSFGILHFLFAVLPILCSIYLSYHLSLFQSNFTNYLFNNLIFALILPLSILPFAFRKNFISETVSPKEYFGMFKQYSRFFILNFFSVFFYFAIKYICIGDPILNLVRLVLVFYWVAVFLMAPAIMSYRQINPWKALVFAYKSGFMTRWQQLFLYLLLLVINLVALIPIGLGLIITLPFTYAVLTRYYRELERYNLLDNYQNL